jgi:hypothetical protein
MADVLVLAATVGFFVACAGYVALCERIIRGDDVATGRDRD